MGRRELAVLICFSDLFLKKFCEKTAKNPEKRIEKILRKKTGKNGKENIKPGDKITIEDVRESFRHAEEVAKQYAPVWINGKFRLFFIFCITGTKHAERALCFHSCSQQKKKHLQIPS